MSRNIATNDRVDLDGLLEFVGSRRRHVLVAERRDGNRSIAGEHPDWDEYRDAMKTRGTCLIRISIERWGPVATGGFPPRPVQEPT